jgi:hypothetical protein
MRISFQSRLLRFTLTTGSDDVEEEVEVGELDEYEDEDEDEESVGAADYLQLISGSYDLSPTRPDYEDAEYVPDWGDDSTPRRRTAHSFGFAPRK